jgi:serine/threonine protein kinase
LAQQPEPPRPGDTVASKYRVERLLGRGGMGAVFEVTHCVTAKRFALKWLVGGGAEVGAVERFVREAQAVGRIAHPSVVDVYDIGEERGSLYMLMELLEGETLAERLDHGGPLPLAEACRLLMPCMRGVAQAHALGIVHRDLKPENIFVCRADTEAPERAKVLDFGVSKMPGIPGQLNAATQGGLLIGTPHYMALEQLRCRPVDQRADVYAFGVVMYETLSGSVPFPTENFSDLVVRVATEVPPDLDGVVPGLPEGLSKVIARALARDARDRYPTLHAFLADLAPFAEHAERNSLLLGSAPPAAWGGVRPSLPADTPLSREVPSARRAAREPGNGWYAVSLMTGALLGAGVWWLGDSDLLPPRFAGALGFSAQETSVLPLLSARASQAGTYVARAAQSVVSQTSGTRGLSKPPPGRARKVRKFDARMDEQSGIGRGALEAARSGGAGRGARSRK